MDLIEIGVTGRTHGVKGDLSLHVEEHYVDDLLAAKAILIGEPPIPYFVQSFQDGGKLTVRLENFTTREQVALLSGKPLLLPADQVSEVVEEEGTPWDALIGWKIRAEGYPELGPIEAIMDLPQHYLAEITHAGKLVYIPLHEELVADLIEGEEVMVMNLVEGLLDLG